MTMCAAITVPIIKDGYRLYPGMPVSSSNNIQLKQESTNYNRGHHMNNRSNGYQLQQQQKTLYFTQQSHTSSNLSGSPPDQSIPLSPTAVNQQQQQLLRNGNMIVGGVAGHQVILLQPRQRTISNQTQQISARSSFEVGPTMMSSSYDQGSNRTAMSTSQLYIQKRRELCIQQQLQKQQEMAKLKQQQQQIDNRSAKESIIDNSSTSISDDQRKRKTSQGDHNNNSDSETTNPFRKLLKRLGFGTNNNNNNNISTQPRHVSFESSDCESGIEQGVSATETTQAPMACAWH